MRKKRVVIFEDEVVILRLLEAFFGKRGYEVVCFDEPVVCPIYSCHANFCANTQPCADVMITDYKMPGMNGLELLRLQSELGCRLDPNNKALVSGNADDEVRSAAADLGCAFFSKPFDFREIREWLIECEQRIDLSLPVDIQRKEQRYPCRLPVSCTFDSKGVVFSGTLSDLSESGFCLATSWLLEKGQSVHIASGVPGGRISGTVRWVFTREDGSFLAGLSSD